MRVVIADRAIEFAKQRLGFKRVRLAFKACDKVCYLFPNVVGEAAWPCVRDSMG